MSDAHSFTPLKVETAQLPEWTTGLERRGIFYEGYTDHLQGTLNKHSIATVITYGIRRSHSSTACKVNNGTGMNYLKVICKVLI